MYGNKVEKIIHKQVKSIIKKEYSHVVIPQVVLAKVTKGGDLINLKILDEFENIDSSFAEIPNIKTNTIYEVGEIVVISFLYGKLEMPVVIRKWEGC